MGEFLSLLCNIMNFTFPSVFVAPFDSVLWNFLLGTNSNVRRMDVVNLNLLAMKLHRNLHMNIERIDVIKCLIILLLRLSIYSERWMVT